MQNTFRPNLAPGAAALGRSVLWLLSVAICGCSQTSPVPAAAAIAAKAVASAVSAATQPAANPPATPAAAVAAASSVVAPAANRSIIGRWVLENESTAQQGVCVLVFEHKAVFVTATRLKDQTQVIVTRGTYLATGSTLTTKIGPATRTMSYQFNGTRLILTDARLHRQYVYQRK